MLLQKWLKRAVTTLQNAGIRTATLDAEVVLADALEKDRAWLHAHPDYLLPAATVRRIDTHITARANHTPLAYIRGVQEFYGREFAVTPQTLTPRPETETLVSAALDLLDTGSYTSVADVGTGSGCIIITLYLEGPKTLTYSGYDVAPQALSVAQQNATRHAAPVILALDDIISSSVHPWQTADLIVANLPYVPDSFHINLAASHEPRLAIFGGQDGLDYYRCLFAQAHANTRTIVTECLPFQHDALRQTAQLHGFDLCTTTDFIQVFSRQRTDENDQTKSHG